MTDHYCQIYGGGGNTGNKRNNEDNELTLGTFSGMCFECNKKGHKAYQCQKKGNSNTDEENINKKEWFSGTCNNCCKKGHQFSDCLEREENKDKCPKNYKPKKTSANEMANATVDNSGSHTEVLL